ncbi:hypothetical protein PIB30_060856 [Stylosanthes scabra]|uniref:Uncharacterized protein n=1 Tax=Stylosanthes scabra TaxID=79078 RepID=A0ABU6WNG5_9FABA|nr:hypothetical protein [Stylosanthes scabra]
MTLTRIGGSRISRATRSSFPTNSTVSSATSRPKRHCDLPHEDDRSNDPCPRSPCMRATTYLHLFAHVPLRVRYFVRSLSASLGAVRMSQGSELRKFMEKSVSVLLRSFPNRPIVSTWLSDHSCIVISDPHTLTCPRYVPVIYISVNVHHLGHIRPDLAGCP